MFVQQQTFSAYISKVANVIQGLGIRRFDRSFAHQKTRENHIDEEYTFLTFLRPNFWVCYAFVQIPWTPNHKKTKITAKSLYFEVQL